MSVAGRYTTCGSATVLGEFRFAHSSQGTTDCQHIGMPTCYILAAGCKGDAPAANESLAANEHAEGKGLEQRRCASSQLMPGLPDEAAILPLPYHLFRHNATNRTLNECVIMVQRDSRKDLQERNAVNTLSLPLPLFTQTHPTPLFSHSSSTVLSAEKNVKNTPLWSLQLLPGEEIGCGGLIAEGPEVCRNLVPPLEGGGGMLHALNKVSALQYTLIFWGSRGMDIISIINKEIVQKISAKTRAMKVARRQEAFPQAELQRLEQAERQATWRANETQEQTQARQEEQA
ncbi:hypothetical protein PR048_021552 [Dryococelus australis]|uniref:Uncharacterized protein n=1 Tax=Dryococelus australis TaxID=614101 RepID=A0ABQ9GYK1_9NEOP|nr:hypothetical protein PR048_021552 [Dryococelus australis]